MRLRFIIMLVLLFAVCCLVGCVSQRLSIDNYEDRELSAPYGSAVEEYDYSEQADAIKNAGEKISDAASDAAKRLEGYADTAGEVLDAADDVSGTIRAGAKKIGSLAERATDFINKIP